MHPTQLGLWKKELQEQAGNLFDAKRRPKPIDPLSSPERFYSEISRLKMELDWLKKSPVSANRSGEAMGWRHQATGTDPAM